MSDHTRDSAPAPMDEHRAGDREALTCRELVGFLDAFLEGELSRRTSELFERHLAGCPDCRAYLDSYRSAIELGRAALLGGRSPSVPDGLVDSILDVLGR